MPRLIWYGRQEFISRRQNGGEPCLKCPFLQRILLHQFNASPTRYVGPGNRAPNIDCCTQFGRWKGQIDLCSLGKHPWSFNTHTCVADIDNSCRLQMIRVAFLYHPGRACHYRYWLTKACPPAEATSPYAALMVLAKMSPVKG